MSTIATGLGRFVTFKKQTGQGVIAPGGAATGENLRRVTCTLDKKKAQYRSGEINTSQQKKDSRHGTVSVDGSLSGELSAGGYQDFFESVLRAPVAAVAAVGPLTTISATSAGVGTFQGALVRTAGDWRTTFKAGNVIRAAGFLTTGLPNNAHNLMVLGFSVDGLTMNVRSLHKIDIGAKAVGDSVTVSLVGKIITVPQTGHTRDYYTVEHWFQEVPSSERYIDVVATGFTLRVGATGMVQIEFPLMGLDMIPNVARYFTSPAAAPNFGLIAAANGVAVANGQKAGVVTSFDLTVTGNYSVPGGVVGETVDPDIFPGSVEATGSVTILFDSTTMRDLFLNETETFLAFALTTGTAPNADVVGFVLPSTKFGSADKDDGEKGLSVTLSYVASERTDGSTSYSATTITIQDSQFT